MCKEEVFPAMEFLSSERFFQDFIKFPIFQGFSPISLIFSRNSLIFPGFCWVSQFSLSFSWFQWFSQDFVDFVDYSRIPFIFPGFNWFFQDFIDFSRILLIFPGFHWFFQDLIDFSRISLTFPGFYWVSRVSAVTCCDGYSLHCQRSSRTKKPEKSPRNLKQIYFEFFNIKEDL